VSSRLPALEEIVGDGISGLFARAGDRDEISTKLEWLLSSEELRTRYGQAGRESVLKTRTWAANARALATAYEELWEARR
jgi:glycosyltransferase involved in cell wall biosynthesis